ncbi:Signal transduction histidine-protein kinase BaeS [Shewanella sp. P1-14-1]|uniref:ATP-binding protein n=1 Tax=Shewanella sp. P1-14-1 TaxID=1723761 RepID=UPI0006D674A4|nr:ATP-binding protein [Shewanella sp. P1-14-1]KPZ67823.1 Signal transduction histidine-protein kinase BaeS [Shewanella sp. P1-14-1]
MKISQKLFLAFIGLTSIVLIATLSLARWSFDQGFVNYIHSLEEERLHTLSNSFSSLYGQSGQSWDNVSVQQLNTLLRVFSADPLKLVTNGDRKLPPRPLFVDAIKGVDSGPEERVRRGPPPHLRDARKAGPPRRLGPPTSIYNPAGERLAGDAFDDIDGSISMPVLYNDEVVATLYSNPIFEVNSISAKAFAKQQLWTSIWIGLLCLSLAIIISWLLARVLLMPVREVVKGISHLSKGNYSERFNLDRQDELGLLMNDIDHLAVTLENTRSAKNRWFADISHELRTPLSILCGEIDAIKAGIRPFNQQQLTSLEQEVMRIKHLVDDLYQLSLSDVGGLKYQFESLNITQCINETLISLEDKISEKDIAVSFTADKPIFITGDAMRLRQLLANVILNSVAYTDSPGHLSIDLITEKERLLIVFNDTKPSVDASECELLFDPLHRQDSSRVRRNNGAGLGLTISRNIVEAHDGLISARPSNLGGLCIEIVLPLQKES